MIGETIAHYRITGKLGEGGMGEVYRAADSRLDREVAIKVLPAAFTESRDRLARFEREAKLLAQLHHPNVASVFGIEESRGTQALVMELVEGPTLAERLAAGRIPLEEVLAIAAQIVDALEAAHEKGIIHRDLKPQNIKVGPDGRVKVLDFGLAKAMEPSPASGDAAVSLTASPTLTQRGTLEGMILGTAAYMSPEQARGGAVDVRSDVWAFGVVLYEMLAGKMAFAADTVPDTLAAVLTREMDWDTLPPETPGEIRTLLRRCLERKPRERLHAIADARLVLADAVAGRAEPEKPEAVAVPAGSTGPALRWLPWTLAALAVAVAAITWFWRPPGSGPASAAPPTEMKIAPLTSFTGVEGAGSWSPDGSFLAYAHSAEGSSDLFVLPTAGGAPIPLFESPYDEGPPRWSPDSKWIAFTSFRDDRAGIFLIPPLGGPAQRLVDLARQPPGLFMDALGVAPWSPDSDVLVFSRPAEGERQRSLWKIDLKTREETRLTQPGPGESDGEASFSADGREIVFARSRQSGKGRIRVLPAAGGESRLLLEEDAGSTQWTASGDAVIFSSERGGTGDVWKLDVATGRLDRITAAPIDVAFPVLSRDGRVAVSTFSHQTDLYLQALDGSEGRRLTFHTHDNFAPALSPDGTQVAYMSSRTGDFEIWLLDLETGQERRLTDDPGLDGIPRWSADGRSLVFVSDREAGMRAWTLEIDGGRLARVGAGTEELDDQTVSFADWSPDGARLGLAVAGPEGGALFLVEPGGRITGPLLEGMEGFVFYRDGDHVLYVREPEEGTQRDLRAADLETGADELLTRGWIEELAVSRDGRVATYLNAESHMNLSLLRLELRPGAGAGGLPGIEGEPQVVIEGKGRWHVHNGSLSADGHLAAFTRDTDTADIYVLTGALRP